MLMVWDLKPPAPSQGADDAMDNDEDDDMSPPPRALPTAFVIPFPHPLTSISSHPLTSKEFLIADSRGSVYLTDWRSDSADLEKNGSLRGPNLLELVEPSMLANACMGMATRWSGFAAWRADSLDM
jgi:hypothetical protein